MRAVMLRNHAFGLCIRCACLMQEIGTAEIPLLDADFITNPRTEVTKKLLLLKPEAAGQLVKYAKVPQILTAVAKYTSGQYQSAAFVSVAHGAG